MIPRGVDIFVGLEPIDLRWSPDRLSVPLPPTPFFRNSSSTPTLARPPSLAQPVPAFSVARSGTVRCPSGSSSSWASSRARVAAQWRGASSRYRSFGQ